MDSRNFAIDITATYTYSKPTPWAKEQYYSLFDLSGVLPGDYFVGQEGTYFIADIEPLKPALTMKTTNLMGVLRPIGDEASFGPDYYGGLTRANATGILNDWPVTILRLGSRLMRGEANLPSDPHMPWWEIFMPTPPIPLMTGDQGVDDTGRPFMFSAVEVTQLGTRITAFQATT